MRIQHNIMAMNSYRNYNNNTSALSKNLEKLSSGYKINRAGDDAAGLAISEKMRAQVTGLDAAYKNTKDATSLIKTAEGALQEVQDMLNRMVYLAEQSANGTYDNDIDRTALQDEVNSLTKEIQRIADSANFNGMKLFSDENMLSYNGNAMKFQIGDSAGSYDQLKMSEAITDADLVKFGTWITTGSLNIMTASSALAVVGTLKGSSGSGKGLSAASAFINRISKLRGNLGAVQNRLDHTMKNLSVMKENIQDAESTIRDTDVAEEMMSYTKNNILVQSAQAMLAQSNAVPQGVLQLLQ